MNVAAVTFVYNEGVNLPIWSNYYGRLFGYKNLYVIDRESNDGSTENLGDINKITVPRTEFDEICKTGVVNAICKGLLYCYDAVVYNDCDEILVPDLRHFTDLSDYIERTDFEYVAGVGLNVLHLLNRDAPLDVRKPILAQRRYARFVSPSCKPILLKKPLNWSLGCHGSDRPPNIDPRLFMFHMKFFDYQIAMLRHVINRATPFSERAIQQQWGTHHLYENDQFVREGFFDPINVVQTNQIQPFDFSQEIAEIVAKTVFMDGFYLPPMNVTKWVEIPDYLRTAF